MLSYQKLDQLKQKLDSYRPLALEIVNNLHEDLVLRWTYNSNAIEGNSLTLKETKVALEGISIGWKTLREHFEALNHREAIYFVEELAKKKEPLSEGQIKSIHQLMLKNIDEAHAGVYRKTNVVIPGADHVPPPGMHVESEMQDFFRWYQNEAVSLHPVERAARVHADFVKIHPFLDANGKTSRLLMNLELMKEGFPPVVLPVKTRLEYHEALDLAHTKGDYSRFLSLIADAAESSFTPYWHALAVKA